MKFTNESFLGVKQIIVTLGSFCEVGLVVIWQGVAQSIIKVILYYIVGLQFECVCGYLDWQNILSGRDCSDRDFVFFVVAHCPRRL